MYQTLWLERATLTARRHWHRRIATRLEAAYGERADEIAVELATHLRAPGTTPSLDLRNELELRHR